MSKEALEPMAPLFLQAGRAVFSINYRLLDHAPWPACGDDCLAAARFVLEGALNSHGLSKPERVLVCGASAGGHLAMMTGLRLPSQNVEAIISLAGPSRMEWLENEYAPELGSAGFQQRFFGVEPSSTLVAEASPAACLKKGAPSLFCIHSRNDRLVYPLHSEEAVAAWRAAGAAAETFWFDGLDAEHGLWDSPNLAERKPVAEAASALREILRRLAAAKKRHALE